MGEFISNLMAGDRNAIIWAAAIYFSLAGIWSLAFCLRLRRWPTTTGQLTKSGLSRFGASMTLSDQDYRADVVYTYSVDDVEYEGTRLSPSYMIVSHNARFLLRAQMRGITRVGDDGVQVHYKPSNPAKSFLIVPTYLTMTVVGVVTFGASALLLAAL